MRREGFDLLLAWSDCYRMSNVRWLTNYRAFDGVGYSGVATVRLNVAPTGSDDSYTTAEDTPLTVPTPGVLANDADPDGDALRVSGITTQAGRSVPLDAQGNALDRSPEGTFISEGTAVSWAPSPGFAGTYRFTYTVTDGWLKSPAATVTVTVNEPGARGAGDLDPDFGAQPKLIPDFRGTAAASKSGPPAKPSSRITSDSGVGNGAGAGGAGSANGAPAPRAQRRRPSTAAKSLSRA